MQGLIPIIVPGHSTDTRYDGNHQNLSLCVSHYILLHSKCKLTNHRVMIWVRGRACVCVTNQSKVHTKVGQTRTELYRKSQVDNGNSLVSL